MWRRSLVAACVFFLAGAARADGTAPSWAAETMSPAPIGTAGLSDLERAVLERCGPGERGLAKAAARLVAAKLGGGSLPDLDAIAFAQRAEGEPHPWARAWAASGSALEREATLRKLDLWLAADHATLRRCGVASGVTSGVRVLVAVSVDALADLAPLPTEARVGQWLTVEARLRVVAQGGQVIVLGPDGVTRNLLTSFDRGRLRARFAPDRAGAFRVQVTADVENGPRPVLEATVFAGVAPPTSSSWTDEAAPGEDAAEHATATADDGTVVAAMVSAARAWADRPALARDVQLDAVARAHAEAMVRRRTLAHDAGDGDPIDRLHAAGLSPVAVAENVSHAASVTLAQRAIWASPSHRADLLRPDFDRVGVGVARDERGDAWVVELFASGL